MLSLYSANLGTLTFVLLWGGAAGLVVAVLVAARSLFNPEHASPGRRALAHWLPIAFTAAVAAVLGQPHLAVGIAFGTSVAAISSVTGFITLTAPQQQTPALAQRFWMFLPIPAMLAFLLGFQGTLGPFEALALLVQGLLVLMVWRHRPDPVLEPAGAEPHAAVSPITPRRIVELLFALALAGVAAWAATRGAERSGTAFRIMGATFLSIALVTPMIGTGLPAAAKGNAWAPITAQAGVVCLNLCVLLPSIIFLTLLRQWSLVRLHPALATQPVADPLLYPRISWRIDAVMLVLLTFLFVPIAAGRLRFDRTLAGWLIALYGVYVLVLMWAGIWM